MNNKMGEYTDLYDENKNLTGEKLFRAGSSGELKLTGLPR